MSNRDRALAAAVELLGTEGLRGLTHARVDDRADLPKGSTSNYFRSRAALLDGVVDWMVRKEVPQVETTLKPASPQDLVDELCRLYDFMTGPNAVTVTARMVLWAEAATNPQVRQALLRGRATMASMLVPALAGLGARDPLAASDTLGACVQGLFLQQFARGEAIDPRPLVEIIVRGALAGTASGR
ncbi:transcriptional regulator, TetR family [Lentzea albidocapillata subsp. violacea]|uniref:Transcriptional regulator, TetR family n=1 Tax=Lentzea albidocapillata subsp. violacea TaxID=128104 RepID=A0A1G8UQM4_9PSEU|nr:TetR/AcrR family transcriptional regulator [Lentzea albidocapillata]SDJ55405.1 transcriptional regulator, TetR family [Lentzea albidocapillata subsp. violacea]